MSQGYGEHITDLLTGWHAITIKRMFGGVGLYRQGTIFALIFLDTLYFKVGVSNRADYEIAGSQSFTYESSGKSVSLSYWQVPSDALEEPDTLARWAEKAYQEALRARGVKAKR